MNLCMGRPSGEDAVILEALKRARTMIAGRRLACTRLGLLLVMSLAVASGCNSAGGGGGGSGDGTTSEGAEAGQAAGRALGGAAAPALSDPSLRDLRFSIDDFAVDAAHQNPFIPDPHEVYMPDYNNFEITFTGVFDAAYTYRVKIEHDAYFDDPDSKCGHRKSSGNPFAVVLDPQTLWVEIADSAESPFRNGYWHIEVKEIRGPGETETLILEDLRVFGCNIKCDTDDDCLGEDNPCPDASSFCCEPYCRVDGVCMPEFLDDGTPCDDADACNVGEACLTGECTGGSAPDCSPYGDQCNEASCDPAGAEGNCDTLTPINEGLACDDGLVCSVGETCQSGQCTGGGPPDCTGQGDQCNEASCDAAGAEGNCDVLTPIHEGEPCDDGKVCNIGETCQSGACAGGGPPDCSGQGDQCNDASCDTNGAEGNCDVLTPAHEGEPCNDGLVCNVGETCQSGQCTGGGPPDCSGQGDQCNEASCDTDGLVEGNCDTWTPVPNGTPCDDQDVCTEPDVCSNGTCVGDPVDPCCYTDDDCVDPYSCTDDICNPTTHLCENPLLPGYCLIDGVCYQDGDEHPANDCLECNSSLADDAWWPKSAETACGDEEPLGDCDNGDTCDGQGHCLPNLEPDTTECRVAAAGCDVAEFCTGSSPDCPDDGFVASGVECRVSAGACDVAEYCPGDSADCPEDAVRPDTYECRASLGACDITEYCDGATVDCPADAVQPATYECRASGGVCDINEYCDGATVDCPADAVQPATYECRGAEGDCDIAENCDGVQKACPDDAVQPATYECRGAEGDCDIAENCDGVQKTCPDDAVQPATYECRVAEDVCDITENCDGVEKACPVDAVQPATYECRAAEHDCDIAENCDGVEKACPADGFKTNGAPCDDGEVCTDPDQCYDGTCAGPPKCEPPQFCDPKSGDCVDCQCREKLNEQCQTPSGAAVSYEYPNAYLVEGVCVFECVGTEPDGLSGAVEDGQECWCEVNCSPGSGEWFGMGSTQVVCEAEVVCDEPRLAATTQPVSEKCVFSISVGGTCEGPGPGPCTDSDSDGICDPVDNCVHTYNPDQADADDDGLGDVCDNCPTFANEDQADGDEDGVGDVCDNCPNNANPGQADTDGDGLGNVCDNCPSDVNPDQVDSDGDGTADACDNCPAVSNPGQADGDGDGVGNVCDNCPEVVNPEQNDDDADGIGDACDTCPMDPGDDQTDSDGDGLGDICDDCDLGANDDTDGDGVYDPCDLCPDDPDSTNADSDGDLVGDACDCCVYEPNPDQGDGDGDLVGDDCDNCPDEPNPDQADADADGVGDDCDNCLALPNPDQTDSDGNGVGDICNDPVAVAEDQTVTDMDGSGDEGVTLDGSGSSDADSELVLYLWLEDGDMLAASNGPTVEVDLAVGEHLITLQVTAADGGTAETTCTVTVESQPEEPGAPGPPVVEPPVDAPAPTTGGGGGPCGIFNGIALIGLPLILLGWMSTRSLRRRIGS